MTKSHCRTHESQKLLDRVEDLNMKPALADQLTQRESGRYETLVRTDSQPGENDKFLFASSKTS